MTERIRGARFFELDAICDRSSPLPHMLPTEVSGPLTCAPGKRCSTALSTVDMSVCVPAQGRSMPLVVAAADVTATRTWDKSRRKVFVNATLKRMLSLACCCTGARRPRSQRRRTHWTSATTPPWSCTTRRASSARRGSGGPSRPSATTGVFASAAAASPVSQQMVAGCWSLPQHASGIRLSTSACGQARQIATTCSSCTASTAGCDHQHARTVLTGDRWLACRWQGGSAGRRLSGLGGKRPAQGD